MIGHQRDILATLGIDIWVPRDVVCQKMPSSSLWRDQAAAEYQTEIVLAKAPAVLPLALKADQRQEPERTESLISPIAAVEKKNRNCRRGDSNTSGTANFPFSTASIRFVTLCNCSGHNRNYR